MNTLKNSSILPVFIMLSATVACGETTKDPPLDDADADTDTNSPARPDTHSTPHTNTHLLSHPKPSYQLASCLAALSAHDTPGVHAGGRIGCSRTLCGSASTKPPSDRTTSGSRQG